MNKTGAKTVSDTIPAPVFAILGPKIHITFGISLLSKERGNFASNRI